MKAREIAKLKKVNEGLDIKCFKNESNQKNAFGQLTESNKAYSNIVLKYGELEEKNANLREELIRIMKERNEAESISHKKKLKCKILQERLKTLEVGIQEKSKDFTSSMKTNTRYKKMNEELQDNLSKVFQLFNIAGSSKAQVRFQQPSQGSAEDFRRKRRPNHDVKANDEKPGNTT